MSVAVVSHVAQLPRRKSTRATLPMQAQGGVYVGGAGSLANVNAAMGVNLGHTLSYAAIGGVVGLVFPFIGGPIGGALLGAAVSLFA